MSLMLAGVMLLAATAEDGHRVANPRAFSANGRMCVVLRRLPAIGDFESIRGDEYWEKAEVRAWLDEPPNSRGEAAPMRGALYRLWPGDHREFLAEFPLASGETFDDVLVADDGHFVTHERLRCGATAPLLTIRAPDGSVVRTLRVRDVVTRPRPAIRCERCFVSRLVACLIISLPAGRGRSRMASPLLFPPCMTTPNDRNDTHRANPDHAATDPRAAAQQDQVKRDHDRLEESARRVESSVPADGQAATDPNAAAMQDQIRRDHDRMQESARRVEQSAPDIDRNRR